jgi:hypothetical protein
VLLAIYQQDNQIKDDDAGGACTTHGENQNTHKILGSKTVRKILLENLGVGESQNK